MRIGINLIPLRPGQMGGAEIYLRDLLSELIRRGGHQYVLVTADYNHDTLPEDSPACRRILHRRESAPGAEQIAGALRRVRLGFLRRRREYGRYVPAAVKGGVRALVMRATRARDSMATALRTMTGRQGRVRGDSLTELIRRERLDLWFCPFTNLDPRVLPVPGVITVHDVQHEYYPEFFDPSELRHRRHFYPESCIGADHIIAVSDFTRRCVLEQYGVPPEQISVIWEAPASDLAWSEDQARVGDIRRRYGLASRYALYPANTWHHKNHGRLIEALAIYHREQRGPLTLALTGVSKEAGPALMGAIARHRLADRVRILGLVPRADLPALYAGAACLVFPSLFEGFGIPLVEAMSAGCPIAAANATAIPEIAGDAAVLFDPLDAADIARALAAIVDNPDTAAKLAERGRERAQWFSASRMAQQTLALFEQVHRERLVRGRPVGRDFIAVEGVYDDQWVGREAVFACHGPALTALDIEGDLAAVGALLPQRLVGWVGGEKALDMSIATPGHFCATIPLIASGRRSGTWEVSLIPERTFRPSDLGGSADHRTLSVRLSRLVARGPNGHEIVKTLGPVPAPGSDS